MILQPGFYYVIKFNRTFFSHSRSQHFGSKIPFFCSGVSTRMPCNKFWRNSTDIFFFKSRSGLSTLLETMQQLLILFLSLASVVLVGSKSDSKYECCWSCEGHCPLHYIKAVAQKLQLTKVRFTTISSHLSHSWDPNHQNFVDHQISFLTKFCSLFFSTPQNHFLLRKNMLIDQHEYFFLSKK